MGSSETLPPVTSSLDRFFFKHIFLKHIWIWIIVRMMASTFTLQLSGLESLQFNSISLDSLSMMLLEDGFQNCPQPSYETQTEWEKNGAILL